MSKKVISVVGSWAFLLGFAIALMFGLIQQISKTVAIILILVGLVVGLLNIGSKESMPFLMSGAVLIIAASLGQEAASLIPVLGSVLSALLLIFVPATIIVAVRNVFLLAKD